MQRLTNIYFRLMAATVVADGEIVAGEMEQFRSLIRDAGTNPGFAEEFCSAARATMRDPLGFLDGKSYDSGFGRFCVRDAIRIAKADGEYHVLEASLIRDMASKLGVPGAFESPLAVAGGGWGAATVSGSRMSTVIRWASRGAIATAASAALASLFWAISLFSEAVTSVAFADSSSMVLLATLLITMGAVGWSWRLWAGS